MSGFHRAAVFVTMVFLMVSWVARETAAIPLVPYPAGLEERARQDIITYAARIIKLAMNGPLDSSSSLKRNGGTLDTLYNLPNLNSIGKR